VNCVCCLLSENYRKELIVSFSWLTNCISCSSVCDVEYFVYYHEQCIFLCGAILTLTPFSYPHLVGAQLCRLSPVDAHTSCCLEISYGKINN